MKKIYCQPEAKQWQAHSEPLLDFSIKVDPSQEGNQEEAESAEYNWDNACSLHKKVWQEQ